MMKRRDTLTALVATSMVFLFCACRGGAKSSAPPPDARRPVLKTESELAAERADRIRAGEVVPTALPVTSPEEHASPVPTPPAPIRPSRNSIRSDVLMVNQSTLSVAEVLYPLRDWIAQARVNQTPRGFVEQLKRQIRDHVRQEIGSLLVYEKALAEFAEPQRAQLDDAVEREIDSRVSHDFGGSVARFQAHLQTHGLTMDNLRSFVRRRMLVSSYTREFLAPQIQVRRDELLAYYRNHITRYSTEETRELLMIELPFGRFLPQGTNWGSASESARASARLAAKRQARAAHEALAQRDFRDVARELSRGLHADNGGSWGQIGQPLQPPYDAASRLIFEFDDGQYSDPIATARGWCIVGCGRVEPATQAPFEDVQEEIRDELENQRFNELAGDYIIRLAETATISDLAAFINNAVQAVVENDWPVRTTEP